MMVALTIAGTVISVAASGYFAYEVHAAAKSVTNMVFWGTCVIIGLMVVGAIVRCFKR